MGETGVALTIVGGMLFCGGAWWLIISRTRKESPVPSLGAVLLSVMLTVAGVSLWLTAAFGASEVPPSPQERESTPSAGGSVISVTWEETVQAKNTM